MKDKTILIGHYGPLLSTVAAELAASKKHSNEIIVVDPENMDQFKDLESTRTEIHNPLIFEEMPVAYDFRDGKELRRVRREKARKAAKKRNSPMFQNLCLLLAK